MNNDFIKLRNNFSKNLEKKSINLEISCWNFYTNSTDENMLKYELAQDEYSNLFKDKLTYEKFLQIDKNLLSKHEQKQLKNLLKEFDEELNTGKELKLLRQKENEIAKKYNSYIPKIDGKEVNKTKLNTIIQNETNTEIRKKAYQAKIKGADLIADDLIIFIKMRNNYANTKGYENYFEYKLSEEYEVDINFLNRLINEVYSNTKDIIKKIQNKKYQDLKEFFKQDTLKSYHYGLLLDTSSEKEVNKILSHMENNIVEKITRKIYSNMGYDMDKMINEGKLILDLYPRKGKNTHGFCFGVEAGKNSRILANLTDNTESLDTLNHEMGHCIYDLGISTELPFLDKTVSSPALTEAIAMMMGDIIKRENILRYFVPSELLDKFKNTLKEDEANFVSKCLLIIDFEREIYKNPEQNPKELWKFLKKKYLNRDEEANNEWASIPHYLSHPAYYQNYFRASLMKVQIYNYLKSVLGYITENEKTAKFLDENIFKYGASIEEYDLIKQLTGKEFSAEDFIKSLC